ncbi:MAG: 2-C-methyl-D-erythritol 2,4-cyclodiphosphate synthase [Patescibacteria group bacterium]
MKNTSDFRIGIGQDSHRFEKRSKPLFLGGIEVAKSGGLAGKSDADVILHSLCNALSSAIGGDSLSTWSDKMCSQGIVNSQKYLEHIFDVICKKNYKVLNVSISVEAKKPYFVLETIKKMKNKIAKLLDIDAALVGITFTSGEGLTPFGRGLGIQSFAQVLLCRK